ncbi:hypothetical protein FA09DRAFT_150980 [Tilletiopsis washingtonensis]|uniref:Uncharacterized protein n=1 Tax=Tilletiopsis washingtonensis TaxID=58919 RepID=A0A316Z2H8_9BASI|nr:hypothetical protein FA09DRAFT_150980 [Tilletiopsis washingtonensis]PWN95122.1 hypothetical protein FA09DRAFT_150980 [Tilletiopsis washingtonensis]
MLRDSLTRGGRRPRLIPADGARKVLALFCCLSLSRSQEEDRAHRLASLRLVEHLTCRRGPLDLSPSRQGRRGEGPGLACRERESAARVPVPARQPRAAQSTLPPLLRAAGGGALCAAAGTAAVRCLAWPAAERACVSSALHLRAREECARPPLACPWPQASILRMQAACRARCEDGGALSARSPERAVPPALLAERAHCSAASLCACRGAVPRRERAGEGGDTASCSAACCCIGAQRRQQQAAAHARHAAECACQAHAMGECGVRRVRSEAARWRRMIGVPRERSEARGQAARGCKARRCPPRESGAGRRSRSQVRCRECALQARVRVERARHTQRRAALRCAARAWQRAA